MSVEEDLKIQVAWGSRILALSDHGDLTMGHLSARGVDNRVYIKRKDISLREVSPNDVLTVDLNAEKVDGTGDIHLESVLHTEIYRARSEVGAVVHSHPPYATALGATNAQIQYLTHDAVMFYDGIPKYEESPDLIMDHGQGAAVAAALGDHRALLLQNHGVVVVGKDVLWAVMGAVTLERAIQFQRLARSLGTPHPMKQTTAKQLFPRKYKDDFIQSYWKYLIRECRRRGFAGGMPSEAPG